LRIHGWELLLGSRYRLINSSFSRIPASPTVRLDPLAFKLLTDMEKVLYLSKKVGSYLTKFLDFVISGVDYWNSQNLLVLAFLFLHTSEPNWPNLNQTSSKCGSVVITRISVGSPSSARVPGIKP
jgi:hypothetical protein